MTASNHVLTGAAIALAIDKPWLAIPLAFLSHFALDALPHFGMHMRDIFRRNESRLFRTVLAVDVPLMIILLIAVPMLLAHQRSWWIVLLSMLAAVSPDALWVPRFLYEIKYKRRQPAGRFIRFHKGIQWCERPWGLLVEFVWLGGISWLLWAAA